jgi:hypothetical protein
MFQMQLFASAHVDTARSAALMPGGLCPAPCPASGTQPADERLEALLRDPANQHLASPTHDQAENRQAILRPQDARCPALDRTSGTRLQSRMEGGMTPTGEGPDPASNPTPVSQRDRNKGGCLPSGVAWVLIVLALLAVSYQVIQYFAYGSPLVSGNLGLVFLIALNPFFWAAIPSFFYLRRDPTGRRSWIKRSLVALLVLVVAPAVVFVALVVWGSSVTPPGA